jgi:hypothetical protein
MKRFSDAWEGTLGSNGLKVSQNCLRVSAVSVSNQCQGTVRKRADDWTVDMGNTTLCGAYLTADGKPPQIVNRTVTLSAR